MLPACKEDRIDFAAPRGDAEQVNHDCDKVEQRSETILRPRCCGLPIEERGGSELFQALWKLMFNLSALCHTVVSQVGAVTGLSIGAMSEQRGCPPLGTFLYPCRGSHKRE